jgi:hypothetical protein
VGLGDRTQNRTKSRLDRSKAGRLVLTVPYSGNGFDAAIDQAIEEHDLGEYHNVVVLAMPEGMT